MGENVGRLYVARLFPRCQSERQDLVRNAWTSTASHSERDWRSTRNARQALEESGHVSREDRLSGTWRDFPRSVSIPRICSAIRRARALE